MTSKELRKKYIEFFKKKGHVEIPSSSLVPENDPSVLFTTAGMHPLVPFLLGEKHPAGQRLVNSQKCIRTVDIDEIGNPTHHTFFEMLGHWSLGSYWKKEALKMSYEFLTKGLGLGKERLAFSVFAGDDNVPRDEESAEIWKSLGVAKDRIAYLPKSENWWEPSGKSGPCGPCTEMFYWTGEEPAPKKFSLEDKRWVEIGNDVLMEYEKNESVILVDAIYCLIDNKNGINLELLNELNKLNNRKIVVTNATIDRLKESEPEIEKYNLEIFSLFKKPEKTESEYFKKLLKDKNLKPEQVIYFDHAQENLDSAQKAGISKTFLYTKFNQKLKDFLDNNLSNYIPAKQKNVDNGTGLERLLAVMNGLDDNYQTDLFLPIIEKIEELSGKNYQVETRHALSLQDANNNTRSMRIIADHLRAATFIMGDDLGIAPSNVDQGYVVRKLIRRAIRHGKLLGINDLFCFKIAEVVIKIMKDVYPELKKNKEFIVEQMVQEEEKFRKTLEQGLKEFEKMKPKFTPAIGVGSLSEKSGMIDYGLSGDDLFNLYATYGFPIELSIEEIKKIYMEFKDEKGITLPIVELSKDDEERLICEFHESLKKHQELSRTASAGKFKGGLADQSEQAIKYHTATHLLLSALREVLGEHIFQKGSNITDQRLRFDFSHDKKLTVEQKAKVEKLVNDWIGQNLSVVCTEMPLTEAKTKVVVAVFDNKYGKQVKVFTIGDKSNLISCEICGGPHVKNTGELGKFKIIKEESSSAGVRRIKAVLE